ncbi:hypothetical protein [Myceligenerans crystallogenes]|uniref:Uncharacterized protein n=1 Tax=Myceligenerans crystallogenes TaxID=316335 RepID=A0ABP4ZT52_9MICO
MTGTIRPRWEWLLHDDEGRRLPEPVTPVFTNQFDAEQWLGEHWRDLAEAGAATAQVLNDGRAAAPEVILGPR